MVKLVYIPWSPLHTPWWAVTTIFCQFSVIQENDEDFDEEDYDDTDPRKPPPKQAPLDPAQLKDDPMAFMKMAKKGKTLMVFVQVAAKYDKKQTDLITARWQQSLFNAQFQLQRLYIYIYCMYINLGPVVWSPDSWSLENITVSSRLPTTKL